MSLTTTLTIAGVATGFLTVVLTLLAAWVRAELKILRADQQGAAERLAGQIATSQATVTGALASTREELIGVIRASEERLAGRLDGHGQRITRLEGPQLARGR